MSWELLLSSTAIGSILTGLGAFIIRRMEVRKYDAEVKRLEAEAHKLTAEAEDLTSTRLIRELDTLAARNGELSQMVSKQSDLIDRLRADVFRYAEREAQHAIENATLRERIKILEASTAAPVEMKNVLLQAFPVEETPSPPNEFDSDEQE